MFVLDTNTLIYFFKGSGRIAERLLAVPPAETGVPAVVVYELEFGIRMSTQPEKRQRQLAALLDMVTVLPFEQRAAATAAALRADLKRAGAPIGPLDVLIAGTALSVNGTLVTHNAREFSRVQRLNIVDWY